MRLGASAMLCDLPCGHFISWVTSPLWSFFPGSAVNPTQQWDRHVASEAGLLAERFPTLARGGWAPRPCLCTLSPMALAQGALSAVSTITAQGIHTCAVTSRGVRAPVTKRGARKSARLSRFEQPSAPFSAFPLRDTVRSKHTCVS